MARSKHRHWGGPGSLQRRLFLWFASSMVVVALVVGAAVHLLKPERTFSAQSAAAFVTNRFEERWDDPAAREALAIEIHDKMDISVTLKDTQGRLLLSLGERCEDSDGHTVKKSLNDGSVLMCKKGPWPIGFLILLFVAGLWFASGRIAGRLTSTLKKVATVAGRIGEGDYSARVESSRRVPTEIMQFGNAINEMAVRVQAANKEQQMLFASVSHEIRTPLGHARILIDRALDQGANESSMKELEREVMEIDDLVGQLLAGSKMDAIGAECRDINVVDTAKRALSRLGEDESKLNAPDSLIASVDPTLLSRAITNLVRNATDHGGGLEQVRIESDEQTVSFLFYDKGDGISEQELKRLEQPYVRDSADSKGSLGIGLTLCSRIAKVHGGSLSVGRSSDKRHITLTIRRV